MIKFDVDINSLNEKLERLSDSKTENDIGRVIGNEECTYEASWGKMRCLRDSKGITVVEVNMELTDTKWHDKLLVIPNAIDNIPVVNFLPGALNSLRKMKLYGIVVPPSVIQISAENKKLYDGFSGKGVFPKLKIYMYKEESYINEEIFLIEKNDIVPRLYVCLSDCFSKEEYWHYPDNGCWITNKNELLWYNGTEKVVSVDCESIETEAFYHSCVEQIIFSKNVLKIKENAIHHCNNLVSVTITSDIRTYISPGAVHDCDNLETLVGRWAENCEEVSCLYNCAKIDDIRAYGRLVTCQSTKEIYSVDEDIKRIVNGAFRSCRKLKMVILHNNVEAVLPNAFEGTDVEIIIFKGQYTNWKAKQITEDVDLYVFAEQDANVMSISPYDLPKNVYFKNIKSLEVALEKNNLSELYELCKTKMNKESDTEMIPVPYTW